MDQETSKLFSRFWEAYPRHEAKEAAREAFTKLGVDEGLLETMITAIGKWKKTNQWKDEGGRYIPNPANWLRQRTVLEYRYLCYMRFTKIAEVLNYGESTIRVWHQKGLERLESFLNPDENLAENSGK